MVASIRRSFRISPRSQLRAKLHRFRRRSGWAYLVGSLLLSAVYPDLAGHFLLTWGGLFLGFCALALAVIFASSYWRRDQPVFAADVAFEEAHIQVWPVGGSGPETKDWAWLLTTDESRTHFYFLIRRFPRLSLVLAKSTLTPEELATLHTWLARRGQKPGA